MEMNKRITNILGVAALMLSALSCSREIGPVENNRPDSEALVFKCSMVETKTVYDGGTTVSWSKGDVVKVFDASGASDSFTIDERCDDFEFATKK